MFIAATKQCHYNFGAICLKSQRSRSSPIQCLQTLKKICENVLSHHANKINVCGSCGSLIPKP